jgi:hypothetical protein
MARGGAVWCGGGWRGRGSGKAACVGGCGALMRNCGGGGVRGGRGLRDGRRPARPGEEGAGGGDAPDRWVPPVGEREREERERWSGPRCC